MRLFILLAALFPLLANGATYYFDYAAGNDANNGTSTATPKKRHFYMQGYSGPAYVHAAGDRFVFKGGVIWPNTNFTMQVNAGGTVGNPDVYTSDISWFAGGVYTRPIWDAQGIELAGGYDVMLLFSLSLAPANVRIENLDMRRIYWSGNKPFSSVAYINLSVSSNIVMTNLFIHDWTHAPLPTQDQLKVIVGANSSPFNPGCVLQNCLIDGENTANSTFGQSSGEATYAYSGNILNNTIQNIGSGFIVTGDANNTTIPQVTAYNQIGPLPFNYDSANQHPDALFNNGGRYFFWHDNYVHDSDVEAIFAGNGSGNEITYIWNNVIYQNRNDSPIVIDGKAGPQAKIYIWNNTLVGNSFYAIRQVYRGAPYSDHIGVVDIRNNHVISDAGLLTIDTGKIIDLKIDSHNLVQGVGPASVLGYSLANLYQPTQLSSPTVDTGTDLSAPSPLINMFPIRTNGVLPFFRGTGNGSVWQQLFNDGSLKVNSTDGSNYGEFTIPSHQYYAHDFQSNIFAFIGIPLFGGGVVVERYQVPSPIANSAVLLTTNQLANGFASIPGTVRFLPSGGLIAAWNSNTAVVTNGTANLVFGVAYLPPGGSTNWIVHYPLFFPGQAGTIVSLAAVPSAINLNDGSFWCGFERDSYKWMDAIRCVESGGDIVITQYPQIVGPTDGVFGPDDEHAYQNMQADPSTNAVAMSYQRFKRFVFSSVPFYVGSYVSITRADANATVTSFTSFDRYIERASPFGFMFRPNGDFDIAYQTISSNGVSTNMLYAINRNGVFDYDIRIAGSYSPTAISTVNNTPGIIFRSQPSNVWQVITPASVNLTNSTDILGASRPQINAWDIGAYEFLGTNGSPGEITLSLAGITVNQGSFAAITAVRSGGVAGAVSVQVFTSPISATPGIDYSSINSTFSWADGTSGARSIPLTILSSGATLDLTLKVVLSNVVGGATLGPITNEFVRILAATTAPSTNGGTFTFTSSSFATTETSGSTVITVQRTGGTNLAASVDFFTVDSSAVSGFDYTGVSGTLSWTANENGVKTFTIPILNTGTPSGTKSFNVKLSSPTAGSALAIPNSAVVTITMNATPIPGSVALSTPGTTVPQSGGSVLISVIRSGGTNNAVTVLASTANGTATAGVDYTATSQTLSWADGEGGVKTMSVPIINSGIQSATDRSFTVNLSAVTGGGTISSPSSETVTILMPRPLQGGTIAITTNLFPTSLAAGSVTVTINRSGSANTAGSVQYHLVDGTAVAGVDYLSVNGTMSWAVNDNSTKTVSVPILNTGATGPNRTFSFQIFNPSSGATLGLTNSTVSIALNAVVIPGVIRLTSSSTNVNQNGGSVQICATRTSGTNGVVTVLGTTFNGTATAAVDYTAVTQTLTWGNGEGGTKCLTVPIINSGIVSATDRTFTLGLTNVTGGASIGSPINEVVTIIMPKPTAGSIALSQSSYSVSETNGSLTITVFRTGSTNVAGAVHYSTQNGSAVAGFDYTTTVGDLNWGVNDNTPRTFLIPILNTGSVGPNRVFRVNLTNATGSNLGSPGSALISIRMDAIINLQGSMTIGGRVTLGGSMVLGGQ